MEGNLNLERFWLCVSCTTLPKNWASWVLIHLSTMLTFGGLKPVCLPYGAKVLDSKNNITILLKIE